MLRCNRLASAGRYVRAGVVAHGGRGYRVHMGSVATVSDPAPVPPSDPQAIRACLAPTLAAEFDREWEIVLDRVKQSKDLADLHELLHKWRHTAYAETRDPGSYYRMLSKAEQILRAGSNPDPCRSRRCRP